MMTDINAGRPSKADSLPASEVTTTQKVQDAAAAAEELISRLGKRGVDAYRSGNAAVAAHVDPLPGMVVAAAAGFFIGCLWASGRNT